MKYFTSDLHAFHKNIIRFDSLPFTDLKHYRESIITIWNETISPDDEVYLLGDVAVGGTNGQINEFLSRLNGTKYLILGNHDPRTIMKCAYLQKHFEWIRYYHSFDYNKRRFILMHYPIESWANMSAMQSIHLHGHTHGRSRKMTNRMDMGFATCKFKIYSADEIITKFPNKSKI